MRRPASPPLGFAAAVLACGAAALPPLAFGPALLPNPLLTAYAAVLFSAWFGGLGPGLLAAALSLVVQTTLFLPPLWSAAGGLDRIILLRVSGFAGVSAGLAVLVARLVSARTRLEQELRQSHSEIEKRVNERAQELSTVIATLQEEIAQRQRMTEALRDSEERFARAFNAAPVGMALLSLDGQVLRVNAALCNVLGYTQEELLALSTSDVTHPEDLDVGRRQRERLVAGEIDVYQVEKRYVRKNGHVVWGLVAVSLVRDADDKPTYVVSQLLDITERKQAEQELRRSEERFALAIAGANDGLWDWKIKEKKLYSSARMNRIVGLDADFAAPTEWWGERVHPDDLGPLGAKLREHLQGLTPLFEMEHRLKHGDGNYRWVLVRGLAVRDETGMSYRIAGSMTDITARREAGEALRQSEEGYRKLVESITDGLYIVDANARVTYISPAIQVMSGYQPPEILGRPLLDFVHPEDGGVVREHFQTTMAGQSLPAEFRVVTKAGELRWVRSSGRRIVEGGTAVGMRALAIDITAARRVREAVVEREEHFRALMENSSDIIFLVSSEGRILYAGPSVGRVLGYSAEELAGRNGLATVYGRDRDRVRRELAGLVVNPRATMTTQYRVHHRDGSLRWLESIATNLLGHPSLRAIVVNSRDVTRRVQAEELLRASEEKYRDLVENVRDVIFTLDSGGVFTYVSPVIEMLSGYTPAEITGRSFAEFVHADDVEVLAQDFRKTLAGTLGPSEFRIVTKQGQLRWVRSVSQPIVVDGKTAGLRGVVRDITEAHQALDALRRSEETYRTLADNFPSGAVVLFDHDLRILLSYGGELAQVGLDKNLIEGKTIFEAYPPDACALVEPAYRAALAGERSFLEVPFAGRVYEVHVLPIRSEQGEVTGGMVLVQNITSHKQTEEELRQRTAELQAVLEAIPDLLFRIGIDGTIVGYYAASPSVHVVPQEEFLGKRVREILPEPPAAQLENAVTEVFRTGSRSVVQYPLSVKGEARFFEARMWPFPGRQVLVMVRDITESKRGEEAIRQSQAQLAHVLRVATMGEMASGLAHELNQPLQAIVNFAKGCMRRLEAPNADARVLLQPLREIADEALRAGEVIRRLRIMLRREAPRREPVDLNALVVEVVRMLEDEARQRGINLRFEAASGLPKVVVDRVQIEQVILNLVRNGLESLSAANGGTPEVSIHTSCPDPATVEVAVWDSGKGFPPEMAEAIFAPFFTTKSTGLGMGLSISRSIVEAHGGRLWAVSGPVNGATFHFTLSSAAGFA